MVGSSICKLRCKYWNLDNGRDYRKACIPRLIWNDGHTDWDRCYYWFKDRYDRIGHQYFM